MLRHSLLASLLVLLAHPLRANPPVASYIFPAGGQRGQTVKVHVGGLFLHEKCNFELRGTGVTAPSELKRTHTLWLEGPLLPIPDSQRQEDYPRDMAGEIKIAADAPLGHKYWRVWTSQGATPSRWFVVGDLPEVVEKELPGDPIPVEVQLPVTVNGRIFPREDVDVWSFQAKKGQTITCAVEAARLGSPLDSRSEIVDAEGRVLAENDDGAGADSLVRFTAPAEGAYQVRIHDINFQGGQAYVYRLTLTSEAYVDRVFPLGGQRGMPVTLTLTGQRLPASPVTITLPKDAPGDYHHQIEVGGKRSNRFLLDLDDLREYVENEKIQNQQVALPAMVNGRIDRPGDSDVWSFSAKKGEGYEFELRAQTLGSPLLGVLAVIDEKNKVVARAESGQIDPTLKFTVPADGVYSVQVSEKFRSRGGKEYAYRLRLDKTPAPDFHLHPATDALSLNRGTQVKLKVFADRVGGFNQPITLSVEGLPTGVTVDNLLIKPGQPSVDLTFKASADAPIRATAVTIHGTAKVGEKEVTHRVVLPRARGEQPIDSVLLAVGLPTPFKVVGKYVMGWAARGSLGRRHYTIERNGFDGPLQVSLADRQARHLQGVKGPTITVPPGVNEFVYPVTLPPWMEIGRTCRVCVMAVGVVQDGGSKHTVSFSSVGQNEQYVAVIETGYLDVTADRTSFLAKPGKTITVPVRLARGKKLTGPLRLELLVPEHIKGLAAEPVVVPAGQTRGTFAIRFASKELGPFNMPLVLRATLLDKNNPVVAETQLQIEPDGENGEVPGSR